MSEHEIKIPFRNRGDKLDLGAFADAAREALTGDDAAVALEIALEGASEGCETVGDLLERLEAADPRERRAIADRAREAAGLTSFSQMEKNRARAAALRWPPPPQRSGPSRDAEGKAFQDCAAEGCSARSTSPEGAMAPVAAKRWWCPRHVDQAADGDMEPYVQRVLISSATGLPTMTAEDAEHYERVYAGVEGEGRQRREEKRAERDRIAKLEAEYQAERHSDPPPAGMGPRSR